MSLADILAAKKAAALTKIAEPVTIDLTGIVKVSPIDFPVIASLPANSFDNTPVGRGEVLQTSISVPEKKELTFFEKMRLKKEQESLDKEQDEQDKKSQAEILDAPESSVSKESLVSIPSEQTEEEGILTLAAQTEIEQAYSNIRTQIEELEKISDEEDLKGAMQTLKKALMQNPAAVSLMEDTDIGKMVIALRRYVKDAVLARKEKTSGEKKKSAKQITQEELLKGLAEL